MIDLTEGRSLPRFGVDLMTIFALSSACGRKGWRERSKKIVELVRDDRTQFVEVFGRVGGCREHGNIVVVDRCTIRRDRGSVGDTASHFGMSDWRVRRSCRGVNRGRGH